MSEPDQKFKELELRIRELDQLAAMPVTAENLAAASAKRRFLLRDLEFEGVFDAGPPPALATALAPFPALYSYFNAAARLRAYYATEIRRRYMNENPPRSLVGTRISLDWFRFPNPTAPNFSEDEWLAYCEFSMSVLTLGPGGGEIFLRAGNQLAVLLWRMEDGVHPAIYSVSFR